MQPTHSLILLLTFLVTLPLRADGLRVGTAVVSKDQLVNTVHGALRHYDLPNLVELAGKDHVKLTEPVDASGAKKK